LKSITPVGWPTVIPRIFIDDPKSLVNFIVGVFDATGEYQETRPTELRIGGSIIMVSGSEARGSYSACLYVYVSEVEKYFSRAVSAGAEVIEPPLDTPYGDRRAVVKDRWGNMWQIAKYTGA
jgi:uncharacterized glyoxalase superfamily protein PhnB